ncbi:MAG: histidine--tRNA ligase [Deltaproteobacteria bacterium]|nr:histidine--tRNA ligase [Deltaproteobacteria bacterium]
MAKKAETKPPKGTRDFLPVDLRRREHVVGVIKRIYEAHGFQPLETPTFERLETLLGKYGEEGDQLVFKVLHRGQPLVDGIRQAGQHLLEPGAVVVGRSGETAPAAEKLLADMGLRYDLTVPLARVVAEYQGKLPPVWKRYQIQPVWRADTPGKGRFREFYQCDVDVVGSNSPLVEADVISAVAECLRELGFKDFEIRLNHRGLLRAFVEHSGIPLALESAAIVAVDKLDKVGREGVTAELGAKGISAESAEKLLGLVLGERPIAELKQALAGHEGGQKALAELETVLGLVRSTPAQEHLVFNATLARGLGYYTGCIFEIAVKDLAGSLGGGGRYDGLIGMFSGKDVPACGFSIGLERILVVMEERGMFPGQLGAVDVVVAADKDVDGAAGQLQVAAQLRQAGLRVDLNVRSASPGALRKAADESGVPCVVFVGADLGVVKAWHKQVPGPESSVSISDLAQWIRSR